VVVVGNDGNVSVCNAVDCDMHVCVVLLQRVFSRVARICKVSSALLYIIEIAYLAVVT